MPHTEQVQWKSEWRQNLERQIAEAAAKPAPAKRTARPAVRTKARKTRKHTGNPKRQVNLQHERLAKGLCRDCGKNPFAEGSIAHCRGCLDRRSELMKTRRRDPNRASRALEWQRKKVAAGLCRMCGKEPIAEGSKSIGATCLVKAAARERAK